jgi:type IV pilus assembly protein PilX
MKRSPSPSSQRGAVLITTVILLVLLTILALAAVSMNSTQTRVATNSADNLVAYQTAEAALNQAETALANFAYNGFTANTQGQYMFNPGGSPVWAGNLSNASWWQSSTNAIQAFQGGSSQQAAYVIEQLPSVALKGQSTSSSSPTMVSVYRITARSVGASGQSPVVLQTTMQVQ